MFVIIVGCSVIGYHLAKRLLVEGNEVLVLEKGLARCQLMWDELGSIVIQGDGTDLVDLRRAGAARADTVVAVTGRDETNLVVCQIAKQVFAVERTVTTIKDPRNQPIFRILGVDAVVSSEELVLAYLERSVEGSGFNHLTYLRQPGTSLVSVTIPADAAALGKKISDLERLRHSSLLLVLRGNACLEPREDPTLEAGDEVYAIVAADEEQKLYENLTGV